MYPYISHKYTQLQFWRGQFLMHIRKIFPRELKSTRSFLAETLYTARIDRNKQVIKRV